MADKKLTEITAGSEFGNNAVIHVADPDNVSQGPEGSSFKFLFRNLTQKAAFDALVATVSGLANAQNNVGRLINYGFALDNGEMDGTDISAAGVAAFINSRVAPIVITETQTPVIFEFQKGTVSGTNRYIFVFLRGKGSWGATGSLSGTAVVSANFYRLPIERLVLEDIEDAANTVTINLGEIAPEDFLTEANSEVRLLEDAEYIYYFVYTADGVEYSMRFIGTNGVYGGGGTALVEGDFVAGPTSETTAGATLQEVTTNGNTIEKDDDFTIIGTIGGNPVMRTYQSSGENASYIQLISPASPTTNALYTQGGIVANNSGFSKTINYGIPTANRTIEYPDADGKVLTTAGTTAGNPVTGDVEIADGVSLRPVDGAFAVGNPSDTYFQFGDGGTAISVNSSNPTSKGISGTQDFTLNITDLDYTQKKYVDRHGNIKNNTVDSSPLTGVTTETVMATCEIQANTLSAGELVIRMPHTKTGSGDTLLLRLYRNTTPDLSGTPTPLAAFSAAAGNRLIPFRRGFLLKAGGTLWGYNATNTASIDGMSATGQVPQSTSFPFNTDFYFVVTAQLANGGDSATLNGLLIKFEKEI